MEIKNANANSSNSAKSGASHLLKKRKTTIIFSKDIEYDFVKFNDFVRDQASLIKLLQSSKESINFDIFLISYTGNLFEYFTRVLKKNPYQRTPLELNLVKYYLEKTQMMKNIKKELNTEKSHIDKILIYLAFFMEEGEKKGGETVFFQGDIAQKFYIIFKGSVSVLKYEQEVKELTAREYFDEIQQSYYSNDINLIKMMLQVNYSKFMIHIEHIPYVNKIVFLNDFREFLKEKKSLEAILDYFKDRRLDPKEDFNIDVESLEQLCGLNQLYDFKQLIDINTCLRDLKKPGFNLSQYDFLFTQGKPKKVDIYTNKYKLTIPEGDCFGDYALNSYNRTRTATIKAVTDSVFGLIDSNQYYDTLFNEKQKIRLNEINFLTENYSFLKMNKLIFEEKFFKDFGYMVLKKDTVLYYTGQKIDYIYFIIEGEVELTINHSTYQLNEKIKELSRLCTFKGIRSYDYNFQNKNALRSGKDELALVRKIKVLILTSKQSLGLEEFQFDIPAFYKAKVTSDTARVFRLDISKMPKYLQIEDVMKEIKLYVEDKTKSMLERLLEIRNVIYRGMEESHEMKNLEIKSILTKKKETENLEHKNLDDSLRIFSRKVRKPNISVLNKKMSYQNLSSMSIEGNNSGKETIQERTSIGIKKSGNKFTQQPQQGNSLANTLYTNNELTNHSQKNMGIRSNKGRSFYSSTEGRSFYNIKTETEKFMSETMYSKSPLKTEMIGSGTGFAFDSKDKEDLLTRKFTWKYENSQISKLKQNLLEMRTFSHELEENIELARNPGTVYGKGIFNKLKPRVDDLSKTKTKCKRRTILLKTPTPVQQTDPTIKPFLPQTIPIIKSKTSVFQLETNQILSKDDLSKDKVTKLINAFRSQKKESNFISVGKGRKLKKKEGVSCKDLLLLKRLFND